MSVPNPLTCDEFDTVVKAIALAQTRQPYDDMSSAGAGALMPTLAHAAPEEKKVKGAVGPLLRESARQELLSHGVDCNLQLTSREFASRVYIPSPFTPEQAAYIAKGFGLLLSRIDVNWGDANWGRNAISGWLLFTHRLADKFPGGWTALLADMKVVDQSEHARKAAEWEGWRNEFYNATKPPIVEVVNPSEAA